MPNVAAGVMAARRAIELLGGVVRAARALNVKGGRHQTVQAWLKSRVPAEYCPTIERETGGAVRCEELRPDIEWHVLRSSGQVVQAGTPTPAADEGVRDAA